MGESIDPGYLLPGTRVGFYRIVSRVAAGGFGVLYRVERDGRPYALKIATHKRESVTPEQLRSYEDRADRELVALKSLDHPNIVRVHAFERWPSLQEGYPFLIMDFVEGDQLNEWAAKARPSLATICEVFRKIALALHEMHRIEIYHRDLKSENVLVRHDGEPIIVDFGIARPLQARTVTRDHTFVGTSTHLAPEYCQFFGSDASQRGERFQFTPQADLHAVGFMFYQLLTGHPPFPPAEDDLAMMLTIISTVPTPAAQVNLRVPRSLEGIAGKLLEKDPGRRFGSGRELADALELALSRSDATWTKPHSVPPVPNRRRSTRAERAAVPQPPPLPGPSHPSAAPLPSTDAPTLESQLVNAIAETMKRPVPGAKLVPEADEVPRYSKRPLAIVGALIMLLALGASARGMAALRSWSWPALKVALEARLLPPEQRARQRTADELVLPIGTTTTSPEPPAAPGEGKTSALGGNVAVGTGTGSDGVPEEHLVGVRKGAELAVRLLTDLEARGLSGNSVEALLIHPARGRKQHSLPAGTILYGTAAPDGERFALHFSRAKLPDQTQLEIDGLAYDWSGARGLAPTGVRAGVAVVAAGEEFVVLITQAF